MHLSYSLLDLEPNLDLLILGQFDYGDANAIFLVAIGEVLHGLNRPDLFLLRLDGVEHCSNMQRGDFHDLVAGILGLQHEVSLADLAILHALLRAGALPGVVEAVDRIAYEGNQADPLAQKLVMQHGGVLDDADQMRGHGGHLRDHDPAEGVGQADVTARECELDGVLGDLQDLCGDFLHIYYIEVEGLIAMPLFKY